MLPLLLGSWQQWRCCQLAALPALLLLVLWAPTMLAQLGLLASSCPPGCCARAAGRGAWRALTRPATPQPL